MFWKNRKTASAAGEDAGERAGRLFDDGHNCAQAVLQSTTGVDNDAAMAMAAPFGYGIGGSGCLCGAVSGGVMALGFLGKGKRAGRLVKTFRERHRATCCDALSRPYSRNGAEHRENCRKLTVSAALLVEELVGKSGD